MRLIYYLDTMRLMFHKAHKEVMEKIGEEHKKCAQQKIKNKWIGHTLEGDSQLRIVIEKYDAVLDGYVGVILLYMESLKMRRPSSKGVVTLTRRTCLGG